MKERKSRLGAKRADEDYKHKQKPDYWAKRSNHMYYKYVDYLVRALAADANSLIDVGSADTQYIENFHWIPKRNTLDIRKPYSSENVAGIEMNFFGFEPEEKYDFVTCLQVLEHIPDAKSFARKLFEIADRVLISVPYKWEKDSTRSHVHDPVDLDKVLSWTGRQPSYSIVVEEPLSRSRSRNRLICYYHFEGEKLDLAKVRANAGTTPAKEGNASVDEVPEVYSRAEALANSHPGLQTPRERNETLQKQLKAERERNNALKERLNARNSELKKAREKLRETARERDRFRRLHAEIRQSRFWRYTLTIRNIVGALKRGLRR